MQEEEYMRLAIEEAKKGVGKTNPNPMVGAVIVKDGVVISKDYHHEYGKFHAERNAILNCSENLQGAELYVTLEPCCHYGRTPPCTQIIMESGVKKVIIGCMDPNPLAAGKGMAILRANGIEVMTGVLEEECLKLNEVFFHYIRKKTPFVVMKYAMTADGKIATRTGASKWITGEAARERVQRSRNQYMGIMVGVGTVLSDDPGLTCRIPGGRNPIRIICDTRLKTPLSSNVVKTAGEVPTILATCVADTGLHVHYLRAGCEIIVTRERAGHVDLEDLMLRLGARGIDSILLEGGGTLNESALCSGIVQKVNTYLAPKIFGGAGAKSPVEGLGIELPGQAFCLTKPRITQMGADILLEWEVKKCSQG